MHINQANPKERACQVKFMKRIYDAADEVLVWMGNYELDRSFEVWAAVTAITAVVNFVTTGGHRTGNLGVELCFVHNLPSRIQNTFPELGENLWECLTRFYENEWFRRVWILQEVAREDCKVLLGDFRLSLKEIILCASYMGEHERKGYFKPELPQALLLAFVRSLQLASHRSGLPPPKLLSETSDMKATDAREWRMDTETLPTKC